MTVSGVADEQRYEVGILIGPCTEEQAEAFAMKISEFVDSLPEDEAIYGAAVSLGLWNESWEPA